MEIAEHIINGGGSGDLVEDDLGFLVERDITEDPTKLCRYLLVRILKRRGRPYRINDILYIGDEEIGYSGTPIRSIRTAMLRYIDCPLQVRITDMQIQWLYNRLFELSAKVNDRVIRVSNGLVFNIEKGIFERYDG